jgi:hypothetical protein
VVILAGEVIATYLQWNRTRPLRRVTWVCGPEPVLVAEVLRAYRDRLTLPYLPIWAEKGSEPGIWDELLSYPPGGRLAVIYDAEKMRGYAMEILAESAPELHYAVFVSAADDFARDADKNLLPHLAAIKASRNGQLIRCCSPSKEEERVKLVASWWPGSSRNLAAEVLGRAGSLSGAWQACEKASRAELNPVMDSIQYVCRRALAEEFADLVVAGQRKDAAVAARQLSRGEVGRVLGQLEARLVVLGTLREAAKADLEPGEVERRYKVSRYQQRLYGPHAHGYHARKVDKCRELLVMAGDAWRCGASDGVAEAIAALW